MVRIAESFDTPIKSTSALRFSWNLQEALDINNKGEIVGADCFGPLSSRKSNRAIFGMVFMG